MSRLAQALGRLPMYRIASLALGVLAALAVVLAAIGQLTFTPLALGASLSVCLFFTIVTSVLLARALRTRAHIESSVITGFILFFLLFPTIDPLGLAFAALGGVIAGAGKFLLAIRGRHVFNPAALAATVLTLTSWSAAVWWVGSPVLAVATAVLGFLVLLRSGRLLLGVGFAVIAVAGSVVRFVVLGLDPGAALALALGSSPIVFAAAFMVTEPLTQPPRRWQMWLVVAIVGVLFAFPSLGLEGIGLYIPPEAAILIGNAIAFAFGPWGAVVLEFVGRRRVGQDAVELAFRPTRPVRHAAGQYVELSVPHTRPDPKGTRRVFSLTSTPGGAQTTVAFRDPEPGSSLKRRLNALEPGDRVRATGVWGDFVLPADPARPVLLVASGIGVTPFVGQLRALASSGQERDVVLLAYDRAEDPLFGDELDGLAGRLIRQGAAADATPEAIAAAVPDLASRAVYLAGSPAALRALRPALRAAGARSVRTDAFSGY